MSDPSTSNSESAPRTPLAVSPFSTTTSTLSEPTSDELPDLGAFTTVLREWSHLRAHPRLPAFPQSSSSSSRTYGHGTEAESTFGHRTGSTTTSTWQPNSVLAGRSDVSISTRRPSNSTTDFDFDRETVAGTMSASGTVLDAEGSTVWNQPRIANYLELESGTPTSERIDPLSDDEEDEEDGQVLQFTSPPPSPALSEGARTIEIASEPDGGDTRVDSVSFDESGEMAHEVPLASTEDPLNSINGSSTSQEEEEDDLVTPREVSVVSRASRHSSSTTSRNAPASFITSPSLLSYQNPTTVLSSLSRPSNPSLPSSSRPSASSLSHHSSSSGSDPHTSSSTSRVPQTSSSFSLLSYRLPESEPSPTLEMRPDAEGFTPDSHVSTISSSLASHSNERGLRPRLDDRSPAADSSSIPSFDLRPDPVPDISPIPPTDPSPAPSSSRLTTISNVLSTSVSDPTSTSLDPCSNFVSNTTDIHSTTTSLSTSSAHFHSTSGDDAHSLSLSTTPSILPNPHSPGYLSSATLRLPHTSQDSVAYVNTVPLHDPDFSGFIPVHDPPSASTSTSLPSSSSPSLADNPPAPHPSASSALFASGISAALAYANFTALDLHSDYPAALDPEGHPESTAFLHFLAPATDEAAQQPSLGYLDEALSFIAAERTKWMEQREAGGGQQDSAWKHVIEPRRKRRRKRPPKSAPSTIGTVTPIGDAHVATAADDEDDNDDDEGNPTADGEGEGEVTIGSGSSPSKSKRKKEKKKAKARLAAVEGFKLVSILKRPEDGLDGAKTPTAASNVKPKIGTGYSSVSSSSEHVDLDGDIDNEEEEDEEEGYSLSSSSGPRAKKAYIHGSLASGGVYKSTPPTPGMRTPSMRIPSEDGVEEEKEVKDQEAKENVLDKIEGKKKKKKTRTKRKALVHSKSVPQLRVDTSLPAPAIVTIAVATATVVGKKGKGKEKKFLADAVGEPMTDKRERLQTLARKLQDLFPEERKELGAVVAHLETQGASIKSRKKLGGLDEDRRFGGRAGTRGRKTFMNDDDDNDEEDEEAEEEEEEEEEYDPRGRPPKKGDTLIHVFIDHSNILIGLLSHLKRFPPPRQKQSRRPLPPIPASASSASTTTPVSAFDAVHPSSARPLPIPGTSGKKMEDSHPIPLPSFATANKGTSRSLPSGSVLSAYMGAREREKKEVNSDGEESKKSKTLSYEVVKAGRGGGAKRTPRHLWHAALALILERGRPVTRRVIVTSSPLYQPMDGIERLGYEVRVYLRVPDLGGGMDRERHRENDRDRDSRPGSFRAHSGGKGPQLSPVKNISFNAWSGKGKQLGHVRRVSGSDSGSGAGGGKSAPATATITTNADLHPYYMATHLNNHINAGNSGTLNTGVGSAGTLARIKYREQGVDELLQLKLHQALAATDDVPEGSTIVLATGDGNVGQFNEDGFLGPVRTALRRGWRVELYAWEDGLSRSWRREFGEGSEWGRKGMFRIIGMEQFASALVEAAGW